MIKPDHVTLYTVQAAGHDITAEHLPSEDYTLDGGPFYEIAKYLKWPSWIWAFAELEDFVNDWLNMEKLARGDIWALSVPRGAVQWCDMDLQCNRGTKPVKEWFYRDPGLIREAGHIPEAMVKAPVNPEWVLRVRPALEAFIERSLLEEEP